MIFADLYANKGKTFEELIAQSCLMYFDLGQAAIQKIPTSWIPVRPRRAAERQKLLKQGKSPFVAVYPEKKSTVDFIGIIASGRGIAIEAKSTSEANRFPLSMLQEHQIAYLRRFALCGGLSFLLLEFKKHDEIYRVPFELIEKYLEAAENGGRKSIPLDVIRLEAEKIQSSRDVYLHFLAGLL